MNTPRSGPMPDTAGLLVISLGSNLDSDQGGPGETLEFAMDWLERLLPGPLRRSSLWQTQPVDCPPGSPDFINAVVAGPVPLDTTPEGLLGTLKSMERALGPRQAGRNQPRSLDLDLICWGSLCLHSPTLLLPHPRAHERGFVLHPLAEICPDLVLPGQARTVAALARDLAGETGKKISGKPLSWSGQG